MSNKTFKVIKILDEYTIVINGGNKDYLSRNTELEVFLIGEKILDPETNEDLGTLDFIKARVVITDIFPKMAICKNVDFEDSLVALASSLSTKNRKRLNVEPTEITGRNESTKITIGDNVRKSPM